MKSPDYTGKDAGVERGGGSRAPARHARPSPFIYVPWGMSCLLASPSPLDTACNRLENVRKSVVSTFSLPPRPKSGRGSGATSLFPDSAHL